MLTLQDTAAIRRIESAIGYTFRDKRLLVQVFTRKTYMKIDPEAPDNEVLEFYGDMLMSYHVTTYFVEKFAHMLDDGLYFMRTVEQFTEMRSHYVRNQYLTERIKQLIPNIDRLVRAQNPRVELPKDNQKAYADLFESLVGAVYLDSYQDEKLIRSFILGHLDIEPKASNAPAPRRSGNTVVLPSVSLVRDDDDEDTEEPSVAKADAEELSPADTDEALLQALPPLTEVPLTAELPTPVMPDAPAEEPDSALSLPAAEPPIGETTGAVTGAVTGETVAPLPTEEEPQPAEPEAPAAIEAPAAMPAVPATDAITTQQDALAAFCREVGYEAPVYGETPKNAPNARPVAACTVRFRNRRGKPVKISLNDSGRTLAEATEKAAVKMLKKLREQWEAEEAQAPKEPAAPVSPVEATPAEVVPAEVVPVEVIPTEVAPAEVAPVEVALVEVVPTEEAPAEVTPAEVAPAEEAPAEEAPAEEAPVEVTPAKKKAASRRRKAVVTDTAPVEAVAEAPAGAPVEAPIEAPAEVPAEAPAEVPAEAPAEAPTESAKSAKPEKPTKSTKSAKRTAGKSAAKETAPTTADTPTDKPVSKRTSKKAPAEAPAETPAETPAEEVPAETPEKAPAKPRRKPATRSKKTAETAAEGEGSPE